MRKLKLDNISNVTLDVGILASVGNTHIIQIQQHYQKDLHVLIILNVTRYQITFIGPKCYPISLQLQ